MGELEKVFLLYLYRKSSFCSADSCTVSPNCGIYLFFNEEETEVFPRRK
jgi:hypothetical protein